MFSRIALYRILITLMLAALALSACAPAETPEPAAPQATEAPAEPVTIKLALLRILDTLPIYVAQQEGLFAKHGVNIEIIPIGSAAERDQVISAGQADGMINETVSTIFYNKDQVQVQIVRFARTASADSPMFHIIASAQSQITDPQALKGVEIGISQGTVIEYLTDRLLQAEGLTQEDIKIIAVPKLDVRMNLLASGELKAAMLPDPFSFLAEQQGGVIVLDDTKHPEFAYSTISFRKPFLDENGAAVKAFLAAVEEATAKVNANPDAYQNLLVEQKLIPAPLQGAYKLHAYPTASVPSQAQWDDVMSWAKEKGLVEKDVAYADSVTAEYLP